MINRILDCLFRRVINFQEEKQRQQSRNNQIYHSKQKTVYKQITFNSKMNGSVYN